MATESKLKEDIKKLEAGIKSKATPEKIKGKLKNQLAILNAELSALQKPAPSKMSRAKQLRAKYKALYGVRFQGIDIEKDADIPARAIGKRTSKGLKGNQYVSKAQAKGHTYYEYRENRIDMKQPPKKYPKLEDGGYMAKGGYVAVAEKDGYWTIMSKPTSKEKAQQVIDMGVARGEVGKVVSLVQAKAHKKVIGAEYLEDGGYMEKGGSLISIKKKYEENEDENAHSENVVLLAKNFGTDEELVEAKKILAIHEKEGSLSSENGKKRQELHLRLIAKARKEMSKEGISFEDGGMMAKGGESDEKNIYVVEIDLEKGREMKERAKRRNADVRTEREFEFEDLEKANDFYKKHKSKGEFEGIKIIDINLKTVPNSEMAKGGIYSSDDRWVVTFENQDNGEFEEVTVRANSKANAIATAEDESGLSDVYQYYSAKKSMAKGGKTQGYDDREDERLAMKYGKIKSKYLNSTHARRDDARFEKRGMIDGKEYREITKNRMNKDGINEPYVTYEERMADGGMMADGGVIDSDVFDKLKKGDNIHIIYPRGQNFVEKELVVKSKNLVGKGKSYESEKITFTDVSNPNGVNFFAYKRKSGFVGFAQGDSAISYVQIKETMADGGMMANGGKIKNQYEGKTPKEVWDNLSKDQRQHFIYDHQDQIEGYRGEEELSSKEIIKAYNSDYDTLDKSIKNRFDNHTREGQYADGGMMAKGGEFPMANSTMIGKMITVKLPNELESFKDKVVEEYSDSVMGKKGFWSKKYIVKKSEDGGMMAEGGRTSKDWKGSVRKEKWGKHDLSKMYENNLDLIADVVDYIKDLQKEVGQSHAKEFVYDMMDVLKNGKITYNDGATLTFKEGGEVNGDNMEMVVSQIKAIKHHAEELSKIVTPSTPIEAWVVAKIERSETDLSDVTHYLDGLKMEHGGRVSSSQHRLNR